MPRVRRVWIPSFTGAAPVSFVVIWTLSGANEWLQTRDWPKATSDNKLQRDARSSRSSEGELAGALGANYSVRRVVFAAAALGRFAW